MKKAREWRAFDGIRQLALLAVLLFLSVTELRFSYFLVVDGHVINVRLSRNAERKPSHSAFIGYGKVAHRDHIHPDENL